jgi:hypothetical protein
MQGTRKTDEHLSVVAQDELVESELLRRTLENSLLHCVLAQQLVNGDFLVLPDSMHLCRCAEFEHP